MPGCPKNGGAWSELDSSYPAVRGQGWAQPEASEAWNGVWGGGDPCPRLGQWTLLLSTRCVGQVCFPFIKLSHWVLGSMSTQALVLKEVERVKESEGQALSPLRKTSKEGLAC